VDSHSKGVIPANIPARHCTAITLGAPSQAHALTSTNGEPTTVVSDSVNTVIHMGDSGLDATTGVSRLLHKSNLSNSYNSINSALRIARITRQQPAKTTTITRIPCGRDDPVESRSG
jgi:hypothetical protein